MSLQNRAVGALVVCLTALQLAACQGGGARSVEVLDERTGVSVTSLQTPLEFVQSDSLVVGKQSSFAYLGPLEFNRMGQFGYYLWLHLAPGTGKALAQLAAGAPVSLVLDDGTLPLKTAVAPTLGRAPYQPVVSWGQTAYFESSAADFKRLAASRTLILRCRAVDGSNVEFTAPAAAHTALAAYLQARGITAD